MTSISVSRARQTLPQQIKRVEEGQEIQITRHGRVVAVLISPEVLKRRRPIEAFDRASKLQERLSKAQAEPLKPGDMDPARADSLVRRIHEDRGAR